MFILCHVLFLLSRVSLLGMFVIIYSLLNYSLFPKRFFFIINALYTVQLILLPAPFCSLSLLKANSQSQFLKCALHKHLLKLHFAIRYRAFYCRARERSPPRLHSQTLLTFGFTLAVFSYSSRVLNVYWHFNSHNLSLLPLWAIPIMPILSFLAYFACVVSFSLSHL